MRSFASPSFFRLFDRIVAAANPGLKQTRWTFGGVQFDHERHSFTGRTHAFSVETFTLTRTGRRGWSLLVTKEYWWVGGTSDAARMSRWARPTEGRRGDIIGWLQAQEPTFARAGEGGERSGAVGDATGTPAGQRREVLHGSRYRARGV
jgi:hypothetical protein